MYNGDEEHQPYTKEWEDLDIEYNRINIAFAIGGLLDMILLRYLLSQAMGGSVSRYSRCRYYTIVFTLLAIDLILKISVMIWMLSDWHKLHLFQKRIGKTMLVMWLEANLLSLPCMILYWSLALYYLRRNIDDMNAQLANEDVQALLEPENLAK